MAQTFCIFSSYPLKNYPTLQGEVGFDLKCGDGLGGRPPAFRGFEEGGRVASGQALSSYCLGSNPGSEQFR